MKQWMNYLGAITLASATLLTACGDDDTPILTNADPLLNLVLPSGGDAPAAAIDLPVDEPIEYTLVGSDADGNLRTLEIFRNDVSVPLGSQNFFFNTATAGGTLSANPMLLAGDSTNSFSFTVLLRTANENETAVEYSFLLTDENGATAEESILLTTEEEKTPVLNRGGIFFNASGPNDGAFDLDTGEAEPSANNPNTELQDAGVDTLGTGDWRRVIIGENGANLRRLSTEDNTGTAFADLDFVEDLQAIYERGTDVTNNRIGPVQTGEIFLVRTATRVFMVMVDEVTVTTGNNLDGYTISYKYGDR